MGMTNHMITLRLVNRLVKNVEPFHLQIQLDENPAVAQWLIVQISAELIVE